MGEYADMALEEEAWWLHLPWVARPRPARKLRWRVMTNRHDAYIGAYWDWYPNGLHAYVCLCPFVVLNILWTSTPAQWSNRVRWFERG